jgi:hypothetical protein
MLNVGPRFFEALDIRMLRGRFDPSDGTPGREIAIINQRLAATHFGEVDPIGQRILLKDELGAFKYEWATIVGVAPMTRSPVPSVYQALSWPGGGVILVRGRSSSAPRKHPSNERFRSPIRFNPAVVRTKRYGSPSTGLSVPRR